ncbi:hypothetical protein ACX35B_002104 [Enterococcus faecalis]
MRALSSNLAVARTTTSELTAGCQQLIAAIDGHTLSGAAYNAGKGLFSELVIPTIHRMTAAVDNVQSDLAKYSAADAFIASEGFLDEDKLKLKIKIMKANQQLLHDSARAVATLAHSQPILRWLIVCNKTLISSTSKYKSSMSLIDKPKTYSPLA